MFLKLLVDQLLNKELSFKSNHIYNAAIDIEVHMANRSTVTISEDKDITVNQQ